MKEKERDVRPAMSINNIGSLERLQALLEAMEMKLWNVLTCASKYPRWVALLGLHLKAESLKEASQQSSQGTLIP